MTICWHVDDLKISHVNPNVVDKMANWLDKLYLGVTATQGSMHKYLGMTFDFSTPSEVKVSVNDYIDKVLTGFPEEIIETAPSPAGDHLFKIRNDEETKVLPEEQYNMYHHVVAQLLFAAFCVRRDIQTAVAFLTTRVKAPDEDD